MTVYEGLVQWLKQNDCRHPQRRYAQSADAKAENRAARMLARLNARARGPRSPELQRVVDEVSQVCYKNP